MLDRSNELNANMIERVKRAGAIRSPSVESAFAHVLRHLFVPGVALDLVYSGNPLVTRTDPKRGITSSSSEVAIMALQLEALRLEPGQRVLEIGAGTGYNAALIDDIVGATGRVTTIDNQPDVVDDARAHLASAGHPRVRVICGDGYSGHAEDAPYDRIIATASVSDIPLAWRDQLQDGGILVVGMRFGPVAQIVVTFRRTGDRLASVSAVAGGFMPLRTESQMLDEPLRVAPDLDVWLASVREGDDELLAEALRHEPTTDAYDRYPGPAPFAIAGLVEPDWINIRPQGRNGSWQGLVDRASRSVALIVPIALPSGATRADILVFGSPDAGARMRRVLAALASLSVDRVRVDAVPSGGPSPIGDVIRRETNFSYAIHWRDARRAI